MIWYIVWSILTYNHTHNVDIDLCVYDDRSVKSLLHAESGPVYYNGDQAGTLYTCAWTSSILPLWWLGGSTEWYNDGIQGVLAALAALAALADLLMGFHIFHVQLENSKAMWHGRSSRRSYRRLCQPLMHDCSPKVDIWSGVHPAWQGRKGKAGPLRL